MEDRFHDGISRILKGEKAMQCQQRLSGPNPPAIKPAVNVLAVVKALSLLLNE
jgi:hypothetical protein